MRRTHEGNEDGNKRCSIDGLVPESEDETTSNDLVGTDDQVLNVSQVPWAYRFTYFAKVYQSRGETEGGVDATGSVAGEPFL